MRKIAKNGKSSPVDATRERGSSGRVVPIRLPGCGQEQLVLYRTITRGDSSRYIIKEVFD